ncbi:MAG: RAQPRD family integrative conjugative element protein [Pseudomonadota bacterium]
MEAIDATCPNVDRRTDWYGLTSPACLRQDLSRVQRDIQAHIDTPRSVPRSFPPLRGD